MDRCNHKKKSKKWQNRATTKHNITQSGYQMYWRSWSRYPQKWGFCSRWLHNVGGHQCGGARHVRCHEYRLMRMASQSVPRATYSCPTRRYAQLSILGRWVKKNSNAPSGDGLCDGASYAQWHALDCVLRDAQGRSRGAPRLCVSFHFHYTPWLKSSLQQLYQ